LSEREPGEGEARGLDVVIVSFNSRELLRACLESLRAHPPAAAMNVIVVDNASSDGSPEMVATDFPEVRLHPSPRNLGFAAATNLGARLGGAPFLLALNPDTRVTAGALDRVLDVMESRPPVAVAGPRLVREDGSLDHAARRSFPTPLSALGHFSGLGRREGAPRALAAYRAPEVESGPVDAVNGAFMLMRRPVFERLGGFDEGYWMYMEDLDLCYRVAEAGLQTWYEPSATVMHVKGGTTGGSRSPRLTLAFHSGMFRFYRAHYAPRRSWPQNVVVYAGIAAKLGVALAQSLLRSLARRRHRRPRLDVSPGGSAGRASEG
jgi:N-acetylglucosaminyl-diphospho-decaprenol L-rhamnosyltransferase